MLSVHQLIAEVVLHFTRVNAGTPGRTVIVHPLTSTAAAVDGER